ncbi:MAG TPA: hypothetical protein VHK28_07190 [Candidatus Limnocylindria bacterium]|nr:hypothetical protein [Candidatus Limnocylindria bacterium]
MRFVITLLTAMALVLVACDMGASTPTEQPIPTVQGTDDGAMASAGASADATSDDDDDNGDDDDSSPIAMTCEEAVSDIEDDVSSLTDLESITDELDDTIGACASVQEWEDAVSEVAPGLTLTDVESFIDERCDDNDRIDDTPICEEVDD